MPAYFQPESFGDAKLLPLLAGAATTDGEVCMQIHPTYGRLLADEPTRHEKLETALRFALGSYDQFTLHRVDRVKSHYAKAGTKLVRQKDGGYHLSFNLAKLLCLPCIDISAELQEVHDMLQWLRDAMAERPQYSVTMKVMNNRNHNGRVYAETLVQVWPEDKAGSPKAIPEESEPLNLAMNERIQASPVLTHLMRKIALSLGKLGPWSWMTITERSLFGDNKGPHWDFQFAKFMKQAEAEKQ